MPYCARCGTETGPEDSFCTECGAELDRPEPAPGDTSTEESTQARQRSPAWPLIVLAGLYLVFWAGAWNTPPGVLSGLAVIVSLPLIWYDAARGVRATELTVSRPIYVVLAVLLLWILTLPVYLLYRVSSRRKNR